MNKFSLLKAAVGAAVLLGCHDSTQPDSDAKPNFAASSGDLECASHVTGGTYNNVLVPVDAECWLYDAVVRGNVTLSQYARLVMHNDEVRGSIEGDNATFFNLNASRVFGNIRATGYSRRPDEIFPGIVQITDTDLPNGDVIVEQTNTLDINIIGNTVRKGSIVMRQNYVAANFDFLVRDNKVGGNLQVLDNTGEHQKFVHTNIVRGTLECSGNQEPFTGGPNIARRLEGSQCF